VPRLMAAAACYNHGNRPPSRARSLCARGFRSPQTKKGNAAFLQPGRLANLLGPAFDPFLAQQIELSYHPESDNCEVMIKRVGEPYSRTLHDDEASCVDSGQFVQIGAPEIFPRPLQIA